MFSITRINSFWLYLSKILFLLFYFYFKYFLHIVSVVPGKTVDSKNIISSFLITFEIVLKALSTYFKSGSFLFFNGVGTATMKKLHPSISLDLFVSIELFLIFKSFLNSLLLSLSILKFLIRL